MWPSVSHFCITLSCPLKCVPALCLVATWWHFLVPWLTLDACWDWPSVMQTPSTIISVTSSLCSSSPAQVPISMNWKCSSWWASTSLCPVSQSLSPISHPVQHPPCQVHGGQVQSLQHLQFPHYCCFSVLWIRGIYVSQTIFCCVYGWGENLFCLLYQYCSLPQPINLQCEEQRCQTCAEKNPEEETVLIRNTHYVHELKDCEISLILVTAFLPYSFCYLFLPSTIKKFESCLNNLFTVFI